MLIPSPQTLAGNGSSPWIIPNPGLLYTTIALALSFSIDANLTANVQYTYDDPGQNPRPVTLARAATVLTVHDVAHGLIVGDAVLLSNNLKDPNNSWDTVGASYGGTSYDVATVPDADHYTLTVPNAGAGVAGGYIRSFKLFLHSILKGVAGAPPTRIDAPLYWDVGQVRLNVTGWVAGTATLEARSGKAY